MSTTHWEGCEEAHHGCALAKLKSAMKDVERLNWLDKTGREEGHGFCHVAYGDYRYYAHASVGDAVWPSAREAIDEAMKDHR